MKTSKKHKWENTFTSSNNKPQHTQGEWKIARSNKKDYVVDSKCNAIALCGENPVIGLAEAQANDQRIVKAVKMLKIIEDDLKFMNETGGAITQSEGVRKRYILELLKQAEQK